MRENNFVRNVENENVDSKNVEKIYKEKSIKLLKICQGFLCFSFLFYIVGIFLFNSFDFGLILELITFCVILFTIFKIKQNDFRLSKKTTVIAMLPLIFLILYDFINLLINIEEVTLEVIGYYLSFDRYFYYIQPYLYDVLSVTIVILLFRVYSSLNFADGSKKHDNYVDSFYDRL